MTANETPKSASSDKGSDEKKPPRRRIPRWMAIAAVPLACLLAGGAIGFFVAPRGGQATSGEAAPAAEGPAWWTCSMHPQIKLPKPGQCPICFMDLIPLEDDAGEGGPRELKMSEAAVALADIQTTPVERRYAVRPVRMVGKIDYDETRLAEITAWVPGRLDRLYVDYTGITVNRGEHLVEMYSPDLVVAQRELLQTWQAYQRAGGERDKQMVESTLRTTEEKLRLLGLLPEQIDEIKRRGTPTDHLTIYAPVGGIVIRKHANEGAYVQTGTRIYTIADLSQVWAFFDAYESDVPWLRHGQRVDFTTESFPGETFEGRIAFIDPVLNERTRTVKVRVNVPNADLRLKPGMFVRAVAESQVAKGGRVFDASLRGKWICSMHPEIVQDDRGQCDLCGMDLIPAEQAGFVADDLDPEPPLVIPASAPLITGKRAVVYVKLPDREEPTFEGREVLLGPRAGDFYIVRHGLAEGDEVVTSGNFKIDSALQIQARPSMMNPGDDPLAVDEAEDGAEPLDVSSDFRAALAPIWEAYVAAGDALARDDASSAVQAVAQIPDLAAAVDAGSRGAEARARWQKIADRMLFVVYEMGDASDLVAARRHFEHLSRWFIVLAESFGNPLADAVVQVHCPMAFNNRGADWLQRGRAIRNPYFGPVMLECGEIRAEYASRAPLAVPDGFRRQLAPVYDAYLELQVALADDRLDDAKRAWATLQGAFERVDPGALDARSARAWQPIAGRLAEELALDLPAADVEALRAAFEPVARTLLDVADSFGHARDEPLFEAYCPMAFKNRGAPWLQAGETVDNPYFGHRMKRCGEIRRRFASAAPIRQENRP